jgi:uncharacterized membrane protein
MPSDSKTFEVDKPVHVVYGQWLNYEGLSDFAPFVKEVRKTGDRTSHWVAEAMGIRQEWDAEIVEMEENRRLTWRSTSGLENSGEVLFQPIGDQRTRVTVHFDVRPAAGMMDGVAGQDMEAAAEEELDQATEHVKAGIDRHW